MASRAGSVSSAATTRTMPEEWKISLVDEEQANDKLVCPICISISLDPMETKCGHLFCNGCLELALQQKTSCPVCRSQLDGGIAFKEKSAFAFRVLFGAIRVKCPMSHKGRCEWQGFFTEMEEHYKRTCGELLQPCVYCNEDVARMDMVGHASSCPKRMAVCTLCGVEIRYDLLTQHCEAECPGAEVRCTTVLVRDGLDDPNVERKGCGMTVARSQLHAHMTDDCPKRLVDCTFASCGCAWRDCHESLSTHMERATQAHLLIMMRKIEHLEAQNKWLLESKLIKHGFSIVDEKSSAATVAPLSAATAIPKTVAHTHSATTAGIFVFGKESVHFVTENTTELLASALVFPIGVSARAVYHPTGGILISCQHGFYVYTPSTRVWKMVLHGTPRSDHVFALFGDGNQVIVDGGRGKSHIYTVSTHKLTETDAKMKALRYGAAVTTYGTQVYAFGGMESSSPEIRNAYHTNEVFDGKEWRYILRCSDKRVDGACCVVGDEIWLIGGASETGKDSFGLRNTFRLDIDIYKPAAYSWRKSPHNLPEGRRGLGVMYHKPSDTIFVFGGGSTLKLEHPHSSSSAWAVCPSRLDASYFGYCSMQR